MFAPVLPHLRILKGLLIFKIAAAFLYCFVGFVHPHIIRQTVSIHVNQRFVIDWKFHDKSYPLLPRSLAGGDRDAILEMEFPLLSYLTVGAFFLDTPKARVVARLLAFFLFLGLWWANHLLWRKLSVFGISCSWPSLMLILLPISGEYFSRFMPDFLSFILCSLALGLSLNYPKKIFLPFLLASLGLLTKPVAIITFGLALLHPSRFEQLRYRLSWLIPATLLGLFYYTFGIQWLRSLSDLDRYYMTDFRDPWLSLVQFFSEPKSIFKILNLRWTTPYLPPVVLFAWLLKRCPKPNRETLGLWSLLGLQIFAVILLDGKHSFIHPYYYIGLSMTAALIWTHYYLKLRGPLRVLVLLPLVTFTLERSYYELRDLVSPRPNSTTAHWASCSRLKERHKDWPWNQGYAFRSEASNISDLGVCFGEIQGSQKNEFGFFWARQTLPPECDEFDFDGELVLAKCKLP